MVKIAVLGDTESIKGFACVGLDIFPCDDPGNAASLFRKLTGGEYGIIYMTEALASQLKEEIARFDTALLPAIIPIPGVTGNTGIGIARLSTSVEKAVGSDIIFEK